MNDPRLQTDIAEIKVLIREQSERQRVADLANEARMTRVEAGIIDIKADVAAINKRAESDHDDIVRLKQQSMIRPTAAGLIAFIGSLVAAYFGLKPPSH